MSRTKTFDEEETLDRAVELFWSQGFDGTSIADLEKHLGLGRQSLYNTYGDKRTLFLRAIQRYAETNRREAVAPLLAANASLSAIHHHFHALVGFLTPSGARRACLVTNSILELGERDVDVAERCRANEREVRGGFVHALQNAVQLGELPTDFDVDTWSGLLMTQVYGMAVMAKSGASARELRRSADLLLDRL